MQLKPGGAPLGRSAAPRPLLAAALGALAGGAVVALLLRPPPPPSIAPPALSSPPPALSSAPAPGDAAPPPASADASPSDPLARAAAGDLDALKQLESQGERRRSAEQALAIARGHAVLARRDLEALARSIADDPALAHDRSTLARLHDFIEREPIALDALVAVSHLPGPESADLLHSVWRRHHQTTVGLLARDLLRGEAARAQASPELLVTIELEELLEARPREGRCDKLRALLVRLEESGDRRCLPLLPELAAQRGCGADGGADCYPCLRDDDPLARIRAAASKRDPPTPWILPRR